MKYWFTSDTHFGHRNVLKYDNRPFETIEQHDETLITRWNSLVSDEDEVYHLGDFALCNMARAWEIRKQLKGRIHLIIGNHDEKNYNKFQFVETVHYKRLKFNNQSYVLCHYPMVSWHGKSRGAVMIHGHTHGNHHDDNIIPNKINVGINLWNYYLLSLKEIDKKIKEMKK